jgi:putative Ig domain-containing protein/galactose oxidase-like protein/Kelch motif protein
MHLHMRSTLGLRAAALICVLMAAPSSLAQVSGQNVNMVSGTNWTNGDPFLQRQNEPSIAVSTRNISHLLAGSNDYRTVDLPGLLGIEERGDAWLGLFKSFDAGRTWQSTLLPGYPLDGSPQGLSSPIHGFQAASDPTVRAGTNGLFYYTGIAFDRGKNPKSAVFLARFIDLNNKENGNAGFESGSMTNLQPRDTIKYIDTHVVGKGLPGLLFLDKPWVAVDIPRGGSTCTFSVNEDGQTITQTVPAGPVYITYTGFILSGALESSVIVFQRSMDCGASWSFPRILSRNDEFLADAEHQGTVIAVDPSVPPSQPATIYVAWRRFGKVSDPDDAPTIFLAKSTDGGMHWSEPVPIVVFPKSCVQNPTGMGCPFDQTFTTASFRSNGYPAMTVDTSGRVYVAWSQRDANGDGKIMMGVSSHGMAFAPGSVMPVDVGAVTDDNGNAFTTLSNRGSQLMPSLNFTAGKLSLAYYDLRQDHTTGTFAPAPDPDPSCILRVPLQLPCALGAQYSEIRTLEGELASPNLYNNPSVFSPYIVDSAPLLTVRRHTIDVMGAEAFPLPSYSLQVPSFKCFRISHYLFGTIPEFLNNEVKQIQYNVPNLPLFVDGSAPFMGDYIDLAGTPQIIPDGRGGWTFNTGPSASPVFHATWTDNRDVIPPADGNWKNYTPPISASNQGGASKFDPTQSPLACVVGQTGMRNQNVYTAEISQGVILTSPQTSKPVLTPTGQPIQRQFVVEVRNATNAARSFLLTIPTQPATATASFQQFSLVTSRQTQVNAFSSQSMAIFVVANAGSTVAFPSVLVTATENDGSNPPLTASLLLNPDPTNPALTGPDNALVGGTQVAINEFYNPGVASPGVASPGVASPGIASPGIANPGVASPGVASPAVIVALNPGVASPGVANPGVASPGIASPGLANEAVTDATYAITNEGNTSASYTVQFFQSGTPPAGAKFQVILSKLSFTPQAVGCQLQQVATNVIIANVTNPVFVTDPNQLGSPGVASLGIQTPTLNLAPGDSGQITIRSNLSLSAAEDFFVRHPALSPAVASQGVNTVDVKAGNLTPPISLIITTTSASLPVGVAGQSYNSSLTAIGGNGGNSGPRTWSVIFGSLPPGLQLNAQTGAITGTTTQAVTSSFTVQVADTGAPQHTATRDLTINVFAPVAIQTTTLPNVAVDSQYTQVFAATGGLSPYTWSSAGTLPPGLTLSGIGTLNGVPTTPGTYSFTVKATDSIGLFATASYTIVATNQPAQITFVVQPSNAVGSQAIAPAVQVQVSDVTGAVIPNVQVAIGFGTQACAAAVLSGSALVTTNSSGIATFSNLIIDRGQLGYTLLASVGSASAVSQPFTVNGFCASAGLSTARELHTEILLGNGKVLIAGGVNNASNALNTAELYDPATGTVSPTGSLAAPNGRVSHASLLLQNGKVLLIGGANSTGTPLATAELYDPASGTFSATGSMAQARDLPTAVLLANGKVLVSGGVNSVQLNGAEIYDPATGLFTPTGNLNQARARHTATLLPNGRVLVAGGRTFNSLPITVFASAEIFDPAANNSVGAFASIGNMNSPRDEARATLLPNGTVLLTGGFVSYQTTLSASSAEIFDPATNTFTLTGSMSVPRTHQTASLLPDGSILVAGGVPDTGATTPASPRAEIFNPSNGTFTATGPMTMQREYARAVVLSTGNLLISGGDDGVNTTANEEIYYSTAPSAPLVIITALLANGVTGQPYTQILLEQGGLGALTWSLTGSLPAGLNFSNQGMLSGTPTVSGSFPLTFTVSDSNSPAKTASRALTLTINAPLAVATTSLSDGVVGAAYNQTLTATGGAGAYTWTLASGSLPAGTTLSSAGILGGTLTTTGTYTFTVRVTDLSGQSASAPFTVIVANLAPAGAHILFIIQPGENKTAPNGLQALAQLFDANNAPVPGVELTGSFGNKACPDAALSGTVSTVTDSSGLAAFSGISSNRGGNGYTAVASATSNPAVFATSIPFNIQGFCPTGNLTTLRRENSVTLLPNGKVLIVGGLNSNIVSLAVPLNTAELYDPVTGVFSATGNMTTPRDLATTTVLPNGKVLVVGGRDATGTILASAELYDPATGQFTQTASMASPRQEHTATLLPNGKVLITGGAKWAFPTTFYASAEIYDPATGAFTLTGTMNSPHVDHTATLLANGEVLLAGGLGSVAPDASNQQLTTSAEVYDSSTGVFTSTGSLTAARFNHAATLLPDGKVLVTGGYSAPQMIAANASAELYDPSTGTFSPTGNMNVARAEQTSTLLPNGTVLIGGGFSAGGFFSGVELSTAEIYKPSSGSFKALAAMKNPHSRVVAPLLPNGAVLLASGTTAELFFPTAPPFLVEGFSPTANMPAARRQHAAVVLPNGLVLLVGGTDGSAGGTSALATAVLYNPATNSFTLTGSMATPRFDLKATLLPNGKVLITGGFTTGGFPVAAAELYDPTTGAFGSAGNGTMSVARSRHTSTLLPNGKVLLAGGFGNLTSAELYDPAANSFSPTGNLLTGRFYHTGILLRNGKVLIAGGSGATAELYDTASGTFSSTGSMSVARFNHEATLLPDNKVLVVGGSSTLVTTADVYDPQAGTFSQTASGMSSSHQQSASAILLPTGKVLISGGLDAVSGGIAGADLYDYATGTFNPTGSMNGPRSSHSATNLPNGTVLMAGGNGTGGVLSSAEVYTPGNVLRLQPQSCSYEGHIKSVTAFSTPAAIPFVNNSANLTFQIFWLDYNGNRVLYTTLGPGQSFIQQTFLTHPWVIADTSPAATCQEIYLPLQEQAPAIFP